MNRKLVITAVPALALLASASAVVAQPQTPEPAAACIDPHLGIEGHWLGGRDFLVRNAVGQNKSQIRVTTTCFNLDRTATVHVISEQKCVEVGDTMVSQVLGGPTQRCRIVGVHAFANNPT
jgi:hypothetical protein